MNTHTRIIAATITLTMLAAFAVHAETFALKGRIPFAFAVGKATLASGVYTIRRDGSLSVLTIRGQKQGAMVMTQRDGPSRSQGRPRLVFHRYGNRYFLREVWFMDESRYALPETRQERDASADVKQSASLSAIVTIDAALD
jgi:hypothetical protein